ncbi:TPA: hypothetical protein P4O12_002815 [Yersinia enterocolitica]|nr:hypothetical protein [Yersinia enterocolitica]HDO7715337.1 hypothetical protein [Yersinia enterocolitica]
MKIDITNRVMYSLRNLNPDDRNKFNSVVDKITDFKDKKDFSEFPQPITLHGNSLYSYKLSRNLRVLFNILDDQVVVLDIINKDKADKLEKNELLRNHKK